MHTTGKLTDCHRTMVGKLVISFEVDEVNIDDIQGVDKLDIDVKKYRNKRSLNANAYLWVLCDKMAKKLDSDKWTVYLLQLSKYGTFVDMAVKEKALPSIEKLFRYIEKLDEGIIDDEKAIQIRCYYGSSTYDSEEMSNLINGTVADAIELGVETMTPDEIAEMLSAWKGSYGTY